MNCISSCLLRLYSWVLLSVLPRNNKTESNIDPAEIDQFPNGLSSQAATIGQEQLLHSISECLPSFNMAVQNASEFKMLPLPLVKVLFIYDASLFTNHQQFPSSPAKTSFNTFWALQWTPRCLDTSGCLVCSPASDFSHNRRRWEHEANSEGQDKKDRSPSEVWDSAHCSSLPLYFEHASLSKYLQTRGTDILPAQRLVEGAENSLRKCVRDFSTLKFVKKKWTQKHFNTGATGGLHAHIHWKINLW